VNWIAVILDRTDGELLWKRSWTFGYCTIKCGEFFGWLRTNFSGRTLLHGVDYIVYGRNLQAVSSIPLRQKFRTRFLSLLWVLHGASCQLKCHGQVIRNCARSLIPFSHSQHLS